MMKTIMIDDDNDDDDDDDATDDVHWVIVPSHFFIFQYVQCTFSSLRD